MSDLQCAASILVVRHGESEGNVSHRLTSAAPGEPLTARGRAQAAALAERLRTRKIAYVYASPLLRAQQTGQVLADAFGVGLATLDGVHEFSMGRYEGSEDIADWAHVDAAFLRWFQGDLAAGIDGGETGQDLVTRMRAALQQVADLHRGETVVVVSHGGAMSCTLPRFAADVPDDYGQKRFVPNCGVVELSTDADGWRLLQWPGDPDRAPHPGDLVDLVGRANAQWLRTSAAGSGHKAAEIGGVPCAAFPIDEPWAVQATLTEQVDLPASLDAVLAWLEAARPGSWRLRVRAEQAAAAALAGLSPALEHGVWITDRRPFREVPEGVEIGAARDENEFLSVFGSDLAPLLVGQFGVPGRSFLVLREGGEPVGCARVTEVGGTAYISGVAVRPERRGYGFGRLISAAATAHAIRRSGLAWLHCSDALAPLYASLGYRRLTTHIDLQP